MTVLTSTVINNAEIKEKIYYIWDDNLYIAYKRINKQR